MPVLEPDTSITLPGVTVLKASAGSGKTWTLTERFVQFLLSRSVARNSLRNILAITFSNNASREMKENILLWLKSLFLRVPERSRDICLITAGGEEKISERAAETLEEIFRSYSDFQVRTIDSFMATVFRSSALELGFGPELEIVLDAGPLVEYAFELFLREAHGGSPEAALLDRTIDALLLRQGQADGFPWQPAAHLRSELQEMEEKLASLESDPVIDDNAQLMRSLERKLRESLESVARLVESSGLEPSRRSTFRTVLESARAGRFMDILGRGMESLPVKKPARKDEAILAAYERIGEAWEAAGAAVGEYAAAAALGFYAPYLRLHRELGSVVERVKKNRGTIFLSDINRKLASWLSQDIVPDIYFRLGERIFHFLIDEFQDTSPVQWKNLFPLVENSLAQGGSLFLVGDTKQAIYGFRQADYTIMRGIEQENPFPSARHTVSEMNVNFRSRSRILELNREVFRKIAPSLPEYREAARRSGLDEWEQTSHDAADPGRVEIQILARDDETSPERERLHALLAELRGRGYGWGDIAVLASRNEEIIRATSWLNEKRIPFISFSSLDVRRRKPTGEILALLGFLDSPKDNLSFVTFILGDLFRAALADAPGAPSPARLHSFLLDHAGPRPLYKAFQAEFPGVWDRFFTGLFRSAGYLPLYDLASEIYTAFQVFRHKPDEEATLAKLLEAIKDFEGSGSNSLRDFLRGAADDESGGAWDIDVPEGTDSVHAMTVHKAKGLGFPVVIVLLYGERDRGFGPTVIRENGEIRLAHLTRELTRRDPRLNELYDEEVIKDRVNRLNSLYVALTRARAELHVIGVKREKESSPFDLLPESGFAPRDSGPSPAARPSSPRAGTLPARISHEALPMPASVGSRRLNWSERRRGDLVHAALSRIHSAGPGLEADIREASRRAAAELRMEAPAQALVDAAARLIRQEPLSELFMDKPGRKVFTEWEVCSAEGRLFRMDRVVVDEERVAVIDWKTGADDDQAEQHAEQVSRYAAILKDIFPGRKVEGFLAYLDRGETRRVP